MSDDIVSRDLSPTHNARTEEEPLAHTPGPWVIEHRPDARGHWLYAGENTYVAMACVRYIRAEEDANARLIAAAPDLLALAEVAAAQFRFYELQHAAKHTPEADAKAAVNGELARRFEGAIAKATGDFAVSDTSERTTGPGRDT